MLHLKKPRFARAQLWFWAFVVVLHGLGYGGEGVRINVKDVKLQTLKLPHQVTAQIPATWKVQKETEIPDGKAIQMILPYLEADPTPHSANAAIVVRKLPKGVDLASFVQTLLSRNQTAPGFTVVTTKKEGEEWQTVFWVAATDDGTKYPSMHRFGLHNGVGVELMVNFPMLKNGNPAWIRQTAEQFNHVCDAMKIDGSNKCSSEFAIEKEILILRDRETEKNGVK
jgi:hypothetical protein